MFKLKIRTKLLLIISSIFIATLGLTDLFWFRLVRPILTERLFSVQNQIGELAVFKIERFLKTKVQTLILHSQTTSFLTQNQAFQTFELSTLFLQDQDIIQLTVMDKAGRETFKLTPTEEIPLEQLRDRSQDPSFLAVSFRYGKEYLSNVTFIPEGGPQITIAIPITVPKSPQRLTELTTAAPGEVRWPGEILGVLEAQVSLKNLFDEIADLGTETTGSVYVVDKMGQVIAHPNENLVSTQTNFTKLFPVKQHVETLRKSAIAHEEEIKTILYNDENNVPVYGMHVHVPITGWGIVIQQPVAVAMAEFNQISQFALLILLGGFLVAIPVVYVLSRQLTNPILKLVQGAHTIGEGNFDYQLKIETGDEIQQLADAFNDMAVKLNSSVTKLEEDRDIIAAERNKLAVVLSRIKDGVIALDQKINIVLMNEAAEKITGWRKEDTLGKHVDQVLHLYDDQESNLISSNTFCPAGPKENKDAIHYFHPNLRLITKAGKVKYLQLASGSIKEGSAVNLSCILAFQDITKEKELERMKLDFVSMAAHELRTPLTTIRGYLSLLQQAETLRKLDEQEREFLSRSMLSAATLNSLVENLLSVARIERGALEIQMHPVQLEEIIPTVTEEFQQLAMSKGLKLIYSPPKRRLPPVLADRLGIEAVLRNLISNAITYTQKGKVKVSLQEKTGVMEVAVSDTGQGIPAEAIPYLFTKFFRVQGKLEAGSKGTGLGLYISKNIIDGHGGQVWVESTLNVGTTFYFTLLLANRSK